METYELEEKIFATLIGNAELMNVLPLGEKSIFHRIAPAGEPARYPILVYAPISDVPILSGDDEEFAHRVTIRIHVIVSQKRFALDEHNFKTACKLVRKIMAGLGFYRRQTTPFVAEGEVMGVMDFCKLVTS